MSHESYLYPSINGGGSLGPGGQGVDTSLLEHTIEPITQFFLTVLFCIFAGATGGVNSPHFSVFPCKTSVRVFISFSATSGCLLIGSQGLR